MSRFFDYYVLGALGLFFSLALGRALVLRHQGTQVLGTNCQPTWLERLEDAATVGCPVVRWFETVACAWPLGFHLVPPGGLFLVVDSLAAKVTGAVLWAAALVIYALALRAFGTSWRLRVGSDAPGRLITKGVFRGSRNPIYVSFILMAAGTFLILGQSIFLLLALISLPLAHRKILREERFLSGVHGTAYRAYCTEVGRYASWPKS